tara:strand:- start:2189 stop:2971 length:783 start_codon:yes stop_codon:yes gene_type:complete
MSKVPKVANFTFSDDAVVVKQPELVLELEDDVSDEEVIESDSPIKFTKKMVIQKEDIFDLDTKPKKKKSLKTTIKVDDNIAVMPDEVKEDLLLDSMESQVEYVPKEKAPTEKVKKKRKPMSEEHKAKLAFAREKAFASKRANAIERKKIKDLESEEKELVKLQRVKRVQKLKAEVEEDEPPAPKSYAPSTVGLNGLSKKDLEDAQLDAIMKYDAMRKERKAVKKQEQMVNAEKDKMLKNIQRATGMYSYRDGSNRFDGCY